MNFGDPNSYLSIPLHFRTKPCFQLLASSPHRHIFTKYLNEIKKLKSIALAFGELLMQPW